MPDYCENLSTGTGFGSGCSAARIRCKLSIYPVSTPSRQFLDKIKTKASSLFPLFLLVFLAGSSPSAPDQAAGLKALDRGDYSVAEDVFSQLVKADPTDYASFFNLALAETALKKNHEAIEHYGRTLTLKPGLYEAELNLGMLYLRLGQPAEAMTPLRQAVEAKPNQPRPKRYLADSLLETGDLAGAEALYKQTVALDGNLAAAELGLGRALERQGHLDEALPHFRRAATLDGALKSYELELGQAFGKANRLDDAVAILNEFPEDPGAREELGRLYLAANRPADAVPQFQSAVQLSPTPANRLALATAYLKNNQPDLAAPLLKEALAANPDDFDVRMAVGRISRDKHDYVAAANQFVLATKIKPDSVEAWNEAATAFVLAELYPQSLAAMDKIRSLHAETPGNFYFRAIVLDKLHQIKPALASYQQFLASSGGKFPDQEFIARQRSRILEKEGNR